MPRSHLRLTERIAGTRVVLGPPRLDDAPALHALREQSREHLAPWEPSGISRDTLAALRARLRASRDEWKRDAAYRFTVYRRDPADHAVMGQVSLTQVFRRSFRNAVMGYWIGAPYAGQGYMTEAISLALGAAFGPLGLHRVQAGIIPRNTRSIAVAERVGFRREGLALRYVEIAGAWEDHYLYAITAVEWPRK